MLNFYTCLSKGTPDKNETVNVTQKPIPSMIHIVSGNMEALMMDSNITRRVGNLSINLRKVGDFEVDLEVDEDVNSVTVVSNSACDSYSPLPVMQLLTFVVMTALFSYC